MEWAISEAEIRELLTAIETGTVHLTPIREPQDIYAGIVEYVVDNGWRIAVFNDCNEWDYIEWVETPDGRRVDYDQLDEIPDLRNYEPSTSVAWERYYIPGGGKCRCTECGTILKGRNLQAPFQCDSCLK
jgi:hypothetical protein